MKDFLLILFLKAHDLPQLLGLLVKSLPFFDVITVSVVDGHEALKLVS